MPPQTRLFPVDVAIQAVARWLNAPHLPPNHPGHYPHVGAGERNAPGRSLLAGAGRTPDSTRGRAVTDGVADGQVFPRRLAVSTRMRRARPGRQGNNACPWDLPYGDRGIGTDPIWRWPWLQPGRKCDSMYNHGNAPVAYCFPPCCFSIQLFSGSAVSCHSLDTADRQEPQQIWSATEISPQSSIP